MKIFRVTPIRVEWNIYNGFIFEILFVDIGRFESCLFGTSFVFGEYWMVHLFFMPIEIKYPIYIK